MTHIGYLTYGDREVFNADRTTAYASNLTRTLIMRNCATCPDIPDLIGDGTYDTPATDPAPWYSTEHPESADFVGILPLTSTGLEDDQREAIVTQRNTDGGFISRVRRPVREVRFTALIVGNSDRGVEYGMDWLRSTLNAQARGPVIGQDPAFTAPDFIDVNAQCGSDRADLTFYEACPRDATEEASYFRVIRDAVCITGPTVLQEYDAHNSSLLQVEFGFAAGDPYVYGRETDPLASTLSSGSMPAYTCTAPPPLSLITDPACPPVPAPPRAPYVPSCYSTDSRTQRIGWFIPGDDLNISRATFPILRINAASTVSNLWFRVWPLAEGESDASSLNACGTVGNMLIASIAAGRQFRVDASVRRAYTTVTVSGQSLEIQTNHLLYPPESVPAVSGDPFEPLALEWPVMYGGGPGYIIYLEGASSGALDVDLTLVDRR